MSILKVVDIPKADLYKELINDASHYANICKDGNLSWSENFLVQLERCNFKIVLDAGIYDITKYPPSGPVNPPYPIMFEKILWPRKSVIVLK